MQLIYDKLNTQKGRHMVQRESGKSDFKVDHENIDIILNLAKTMISHSFEKIDQEQKVFLDLIQLFIDLLKEDSMLTGSQKGLLRDIYHKITQ